MHSDERRRINLITDHDSPDLESDSLSSATPRRFSLSRFLCQHDNTSTLKTSPHKHVPRRDSVLYQAGRVERKAYCKVPSTPATMSKQHYRMLQVERFFRQSRMLLRHCCRFRQQCYRFQQQCCRFWQQCRTKFRPFDKVETN